MSGKWEMITIKSIPTDFYSNNENQYYIIGDNHEADLLPSLTTKEKMAIIHKLELGYKIGIWGDKRIVKATKLTMLPSGDIEVIKEDGSILTIEMINDNQNQT